MPCGPGSSILSFGLNKNLLKSLSWLTRNRFTFRLRYLDFLRFGAFPKGLCGALPFQRFRIYFPWRGTRSSRRWARFSWRTWQFGHLRVQIFKRLGLSTAFPRSTTPFGLRFGFERVYRLMWDAKHPRIESTDCQLLSLFHFLWLFYAAIYVFRTETSYI